MSQTSPPKTFMPLFCPNSRCLYHSATEIKFWVKNGIERTNKPPGVNQKYKCRQCGRVFSRNTFSIDFRKKLPGIGEEVLTCSLGGMSNNTIANKLEVAEATVRNRLKSLAEQSILFEKEVEKDLKIEEPVAYDGFETFTYDQFSPCYVNTAVGSKSLYTYSTTFSPLNRKGRMTRRQKDKLQKLLKVHGRYPSNAIRKTSEYVFDRLQSRTSGDLRLFTDEHQSYFRALANVGTGKIKHVAINSKAPRTASNPLFPINHLHRNYRHFFSSQHRETISFQKHEAGLMDKILLMKVHKNFMRPKFARSNPSDPDAGRKSPAMYLGLAEEVLKFKDVFSRRRFKSHYKLDDIEEKLYHRRYEYSRRKIAS